MRPTLDVYDDIVDTVIKRMDEPTVEQPDQWVVTTGKSTGSVQSAGQPCSSSFLSAEWAVVFRSTEWFLGGWSAAHSLVLTVRTMGLLTSKCAKPSRFMWIGTMLDHHMVNWDTHTHLETKNQKLQIQILKVVHFINMNKKHVKTKKKTYITSNVLCSIYILRLVWHFSDNLYGWYCSFSHFDKTLQGTIRTAKTLKLSIQSLSSSRVVSAKAGKSEAKEVRDTSELRWEQKN